MYYADEKKLMKHVPILLGGVLGMYFISTLSIFSISSVKDYNNHFLNLPPLFLKQIISIIVSVFCFRLIQSLDLNQIAKKTWLYLLISFLMMLLLFIPSLRVEIAHNKNWIKLGSGFQIEPIEYFKGAFILWLAYTYSNMRKNKGRFYINSFLLLFLTTIVISILGDLGNLTIILVIFPLLLYFTNANYITFLPYSLFSFIFLIFAIKKRIQRFSSIFNKNNGSNYNYQSIQSLRAIQHGGLNGSNNLLDIKHLPDASTDYIFSSIINQFGFLGFIVLIFLFITILISLIGMAMHVTNVYGRTVILGIFLWIAVNNICNMLVCLNLLPVFGVPFIFLSYGGSYNIAIASMLSIAVLCYKNNNKDI